METRWGLSLRARRRGHRERLIVRTAHISLEHSALARSPAGQISAGGGRRWSRWCRASPFEFDSDHVEQREFAGVVPGASEAAENASALMVQNPREPRCRCRQHTCISARGSAREGDIERRADRLAPRRAVRRGRIGGARLHVDDALHGARLVEHFDPVVAAVADIEQPLVVELGAMGMAAADQREEAPVRRPPRPTGARTCRCASNTTTRWLP